MNKSIESKINESWMKKKISTAYNKTRNIKDLLFLSIQEPNQQHTLKYKIN